MRDNIRKTIDDFLTITFCLTEEELQAVDHLIPMTQEIFDSIMEKCGELEISKFFVNFINEYPDFFMGYAEKLEIE